MEKNKKFYVGVCSLDIHIQNCHSLKEKRRVISSLKEKLKNRFNIAMCEFGDQDLWQRSQIALVTCSNEMNKIERIINSSIEHISHIPLVTVLNSEFRVL